MCVGNCICVCVSEIHVVIIILLTKHIYLVKFSKQFFFLHIFPRLLSFCPYFFFCLHPVNSAFPIVPCSGPSAVPWWRSCRCPWSANAGSNTSPSHPLWWKRRRSSTCTLSTTADCQGKRPWPEMGISTMLSPSLLQRGGLQRHRGKWRGEMVNRVVTGFQSLIIELLWVKAEVCRCSDEIYRLIFFLWITCA